MVEKHTSCCTWQNVPTWKPAKALHRKSEQPWCRIDLISTPQAGSRWCQDSEKGIACYEQAQSIHIHLLILWAIWYWWMEFISTQWVYHAPRSSWGCRKTTTLRILGGFETPDKEQVILMMSTIPACLQIKKSVCFSRNILAFTVISLRKIFALD